MRTDIYNSETETWHGYYDQRTHVGVLDDWWDADLLQKTLDEFGERGVPRWPWTDNYHEQMFQGSDPLVWGTALRALLGELRDPEFVSMLEDLSGVPGLEAQVADGGYRQYSRGGYQDFHVPKNPGVHGWHRFYVEVTLNHDWNPDDGGDFSVIENPPPFSPVMMAAMPVEDFALSVTPEFNRTVLVKTRENSFRGVGHTRAPRRSVVMHYYSDEPPEDYTSPHQTIWWSV